MSDRFIHTIWCDDIRHEMGNKPSLMGVYTGHLIVPQLPTQLPRLGVFSTLDTPLANPFKSGIKIIVRRDDGHEFVKVEAEAPATSPSSDDGREVTRIQVGTAFGLGPVELPVGCKYLVVEATVDGETISGNKLWVKADSVFFDQVMHPPVRSPAPPSP